MCFVARFHLPPQKHTHTNLYVYVHIGTHVVHLLLSPYYFCLFLLLQDFLELKPVGRIIKPVVVHMRLFLNLSPGRHFMSSSTAHVFSWTQAHGLQLIRQYRHWFRRWCRHCIQCYSLQLFQIPNIRLHRLWHLFLNDKVPTSTSNAIVRWC